MQSFRQAEMQDSFTDAQCVTLKLGAEMYAVPVSVVREILEYQAPRRMADGPDFLMGLMDVRGCPVPMIDLRRKLGLSATCPGPMTRTMVVEVVLDGRALSLGLVADQVLDVVPISTGELAPVPDVGVAWHSAYMTGVVRRGDDFVVLLNLPRLFTASEIVTLSAENAA